MNDTQLSKIKSLLEAMNEMSNSEDWSESHAQEIIIWGGDLYKEIYESRD